MNLRRLLVHSLIAAAAVGLAYFASARPAAKRAEVDRPVVYPIQPRELRQVSFERPGVALSLEPRVDEGKEPYVWVTLTPESKPPVSFRGNRRASFIVEGYAPLRAIRSLGHLSPAQLREGGLERSTETVAVRLASGERKLTLGSDTVAGEGRRAVAVDSGEVFILPRELIGSADRAVLEMFDSSLHAEHGEEATRLIIQSLGRVREAVSAPHAEGSALWSWREDPEHPSQELTSWAEHLGRMLARAPTVPEELGEPVLTVTYFHAEQPRGFLKLWPCLDEGRLLHCVGMTEHTVGPVEMSQVAQQIINDAQRLLGPTGQGEQARAVK